MCSLSGQVRGKEYFRHKQLPGERLKGVKQHGKFGKLQGESVMQDEAEELGQIGSYHGRSQLPSSAPCMLHPTSQQKQHACPFLNSDNLSLKFQALPGSATFHQVPDTGMHSQQHSICATQRYTSCNEGREKEMPKIQELGQAGETSQRLQCLNLVIRDEC